MDVGEITLTVLFILFYFILFYFILPQNTSNTKKDKAITQK